MELGISDTANAANASDTDADRPGTGSTDSPPATGDGTTGGTAEAEQLGAVPAEAASESAGSERSIDDIERLLGEVEDALTRLDDGTYGRCATCGATLDDERLTESPTTARCAECDAGADDPG